MTKQYSKRKVPKKGDPDYAVSVTVSLSPIYVEAIELLYPHASRSKTIRAVLEESPLFMEKLKELREELE